MPSPICYFVASVAAPTDSAALSAAQQQAPLFALRSTLTYTEAITVSPLTVSGGGTYVVDLALIPALGVQGLLVKYESGEAPITVKFGHNNVTNFAEIQPLGGMAIVNPGGSDTAINRLEIDATGVGVLRIFAGG